MWYLLPAKTKSIKNNFIFANLLRCIVDHIIHIHIYFIYTNTIDTIAGVDVVSPKQKWKILKHLLLL